MARALVAGCGYVGSRLAVELADDGWNVWGLRRSADRVPDGVQPVRADLRRPGSIGPLPTDLDLVVYAVSADESTEQGYRTAYIDGLATLVRTLVEGNRAPGRLLFVSSTAVYGQTGGEWVDEDAPTEPSGFRGRILLEAEKLALASVDDSAVVRLGGIYGPGRARLLDRVRSGEARCPPDPPVYSNRIHRDDAAGILHHLAVLEGPDDVYLGVDEEPAPLCDVLRWLARETGAPEPERSDGAEGGRRRRTNKRCSSERIRGSGYRFRYPSFRQGYGELI